VARIGINPARGKISSYRPARVTAVLITYIPTLEGYFSQRLDILKAVLASVRRTEEPFDLLVFDNASCAPVVDYLREMENAGAIDYLLLSRRNVGKIGAFQIAFPAAPGEIIAYSDDDILFYPGWLEAQLRILEAFPRVGMVSGVPVRDAFTHARGALEEFASNPPAGVEVRRERRIPDEWEADWALSTGRDPQEHLAATAEHLDLVLRRGGVEAIGGANHFQFVAPKEVMMRALPREWTGHLMGQMRELDAAVDRLGYLRLSTAERYVRHIGNVITPDLAEEVRALGVEASKPLMRVHRHWLLRIPGMGRLLWAIYNRLFYILHPVE